MSNLVSSPKNVVYVNGGQTYNVSAADDVINVNSNLGATEIVLPNIVNQGLDFYPKKFTVNDTGGVAGTNPITISAVGNIVNSGTSFILNRNNVSSEIVIVSKTEYLVNTDNGGSTGVFGSGVAGQLAYFSASTVLGSLTNAQVTVLIDPMVGDSGSGGLKGLAPAPAAGDAAANKYLKADGTWNAISFAGYLKADGTVPLTANWDVGAFEVTAQSLKVDGTAGAGHFHLRYQSAIPTGAANNSKLFSGATGALGWVVDSNAYAFYLDMTGNTASRTLTVPNASGTIALTTDIVNLGNSNLTSTDNARYFKLNGTTSSNFLKFRNSSDISILSLFGDKSIVFGNSGNPVSINFNIDASDATGDTWYRNSGGLMTRLGIGTSGQVLTVSGGGIPTWAAVTAPNLGTANLTSTDDARTFTLKSGGTASQYLQILNSGGGNLLKLSGNKAIDFGSGTHPINPKFYLDGDIYQYFSIYNKTNANSICDIFATSNAANGVFYLKNAAGNTKISMNAGSGGVYTETAIITLAGQYSSYRVSNSIGNNIVDLRSGNTDNGEFYLFNSSGTYKVQIAVGGSVIDTNLKVGGSFASATAALQIVGGGSTSATTTALFQNSSSAKSLEILDDKTINFGSSTSFVQPNIYLNSTLNDQFTIFRGSSYFVNINPLAWQLEVRGSSGKYVYLNGDSGMITTRGDNSGITLNNAAGNPRGYFYQQSSGGFFALVDSAGTRQVNLECGATAVIGLNTQIGGAYTDSLTAKFTVKGIGTTSSTTTALFQNSSSVAALTIKDDLTSTFGGIVTVPQIITTPATITVTANAGTVTRANRINKFTNSSAATMTITMSTTAALDGDMVQVRIYDFSASAQTITWVNTENSTITVPTTSNGSTTLPLTVGFQYNSATSKWRCIGSV